MPRIINNLYNSFSDIGGIGRVRDDKAGINNVFTGGAKGLITGIRNVANDLGITKPSANDFNRGINEFFATMATAPARNAANISRLDTPEFLGLLTAFLPVGTAMKLVSKGKDLMKTVGPQATADYIIRAAHAERNNLVLNVAKKSPKVQSKIASGVNRLKSDIKGSIDETIANFTKRANDPKLSADERSFARMVRDNSEKIKNLADDLGIKSKKEIPNIIKFIKQTGDIMKNAPINIKRAAKGLGPVGIGATGLSLFDLWQAFKEGGDNLIPTLSRDVAMTGATMIPGGNLLRILYGTLGYVSGDKLGRWAQRKLGMTPKVDEGLQAEYNSGMAFPDLAGTIRNQMSGVQEPALGNDEYPIGLSGRKYHVVGDRIYSFDTGRPVPVAQAIDDINQNINYINQQYVDKIQANEQALKEVAQAEQSGYQVNPEYKQQLANQSGQLIKAVQRIANPISVSEYNDDGDIVAQVNADNNVVSPQMQQLSAQAQAQQQYQQLNQLYNQIYDTVQKQAYQALDQYISPKALAVEYNQHMLQVAHGQAPYMNIDQFVEMRKLQAMPAMQSQIQQQANMVFKNYLDREAAIQAQMNADRDYALEVRKQDEVERAGYTDDVINAFKAEETMRHNIASEDLSSRGYDIEQQRADTAAETEARQQKLLPFQQASYATEALMNAGFSDVPTDTIINSNPEVFGQVYPGTKPKITPEAQSKGQKKRQEFQAMPFTPINLPQINFSQLRNR